MQEGLVNVEKLTPMELKSYVYELQARIYALVDWRSQQPLDKLHCRQYVIRDIDKENEEVKKAINRVGKFFDTRVTKMITDEEQSLRDALAEYLEQNYRQADTAVSEEMLKRAGTSTDLMYAWFIALYHVNVPHAKFINLLREMGYEKDKAKSLYTQDIFYGWTQCILHIYPKPEFLATIRNYKHTIHK
jgi:hypothetical protein